MNYKVMTKSGTNYLNVKSWKQSELDEMFIEFVWGEGLLILPKNEILAIKYTSTK